MIQWQMLRESMQTLNSYLNFTDTHPMQICSLLPKIALAWQLSVAREIILSGFQQDLYSSRERSLTYWFAAQIIDLHLALIEEFVTVVRKESPTCMELYFQSQFLAALSVMCMAMCALTSRQSSLPRPRVEQNFKRRYKWLFAETFPDNQEQQLIPVPDLDQFFAHITQLSSDGPYSPRASFGSAKAILLSLAESNPNDFWDARSNSDRLWFIRDLAGVCERLKDVPDSILGLRATEIFPLHWDASVHPWFPDLVNLT